MESLFERPGWRAVGTIAGTVLAAAALAWAAITATSGEQNVGGNAPSPSSSVPSSEGSAGA